MSKLLNIATDFSKTPAGRYREAHGDHSGEAFREDKLLPYLREAIDTKSKLIVRLDGTAGYPASFLDEAFGGLIRHGYCKPDEVKHYLKVEALDPAYEVYKSMILQCIDEAKPTNP